jgi:hypothetical protein
MRLPQLVGEIFDGVGARIGHRLTIAERRGRLAILRKIDGFAAVFWRRIDAQAFMGMTDT